MFFKQVKSGGDRNFAYIIASENTKECAIIDPSPDASGIASAVKKESFKVRYLINTHSHYDHSGGNDDIVKLFSGKDFKMINCENKSGENDLKTIVLGDITMQIINTPGHTPDSICVKAGINLMTGDTLFVGKVGGTYSKTDAKKEFESLKKLMSLPDDTKVWPGHDYGVMPDSTIGFEKENNPFIKRLDDFEEFLWLKQNWAQYKKEHGIK